LKKPPPIWVFSGRDEELAMVGKWSVLAAFIGVVIWWLLSAWHRIASCSPAWVSGDNTTRVLLKEKAAPARCFLSGHEPILAGVPYVISVVVVSKSFILI
jgi:hypothetical protein